MLERGKFSARPRDDPKYFGGQTPFIQTGDITAAHKVVREFSQTLNPMGVRVSRVFPRGTLFFTIAANIGDLAFCDFDTACPDSVLTITPNSCIDKFWLYYALSHRKHEFERLATQNAQLNINLEKLRPFTVAVPPPKEQLAIAGALSDVDALICALDRLIEKKRAIKLATLQHLLSGKTRLAGFKSGTKKSELGRLPSEWDTPRLSDLFTFKNGLNKGKEFFGYGTPIVNYMDVYRHRGLRAADLLGRVSLSAGERKNFNVRKGDVFFTRTSETAAEVGISSVMLEDVGDTVFSGFVLRARPKNQQLDDAFKQYCFSTQSVRKQIVSQTAETTRALTNGRALGAVMIACPPLEEQRAIAAVIGDMDDEISALERRRDKTKLIKQGMMQVLLTGKVRLA